MIERPYCGQLLDACHGMEERGMTVGTWGNISIRVDEHHFLVTPSGMKYATLVVGDMVEMDLEGHVTAGSRKPSIEAGLHRAIFKARADVVAIIHTHPKFSTAFAIARKDIPPASEELVQIIGEGVRCAEYALPGSEELAKHAVAALGERNACLLANHGAICVGPTLERAFIVAEVLEKAAQTIIYAGIIGTPFVLSHEDCVAMQDFVTHRYGQK